MKVLQVLALLIAGIALCNAVAIGNTGSTGATGGEASKAEEVKAEKAKKEEMEHTVASKRNEQMGNIKKVIETAIADTNKYAGEQKSACTTEDSESKKWAKEADPEAAEKARLARRVNKQKLLEAIEYRQKVLKKFLDKLYSARMTLGDSIHRTNNIYFSAYDANVNTQIQSHNAIQFLGVAAIGKHNRGTMGIFVPIKLPNIHDDEKEEEAAEKKDGVESSTGATGATGGADSDASPEVQKQKQMIANNHAEYKAAKQRQLMEVQSKVDKSLANCVGAECEADYKSAFVLYKMAFDTDCANYKVFDVEQRIPLRQYREGLKELIKAREAKLKALEKQAAELRASLADPGTTLAELFPLIDKHIKIQDVACKKMPLNTEKILKELKAMQSDVTSGKFSCEIEGGETPISATGTDSGSSSSSGSAGSSGSSDSSSSSGSSDSSSSSGSTGPSESSSSSGSTGPSSSTDASPSADASASSGSGDKTTGPADTVEEVLDGSAEPEGGRSRGGSEDAGRGRRL